MFRKLLKGLAVLLIVFLILIGPTTLFWIQWMMPANGFPADIDSQFSAEGTADPDLTADLERILVEQRNESGAPSMSAAISRDRVLLWAGASGYAALESGERATPNSVYRLGSTSKALTGTLLGRLVDAGTIDLDATVADYAPRLPDHLHAITVRQLASHTGGIRHYSRMLTWLPASHESISSHHYASVEDGLVLFVEDELVFPPGSDFNYTTFGYSLLAYLMERAAGTNFASLLDRHLNTPLDTDLRLDDLSIDMPDRATTYTTAKGRWARAYPADPSYKWAGGGIVATPSDLVRIGQALMDDAFITTPTRSLLWSPVALPDSDSNPQNYGIGWRIDASTRTLGESQPVQLIHHGGIQMGGVAFWAIYPELGMSVAVVSNTGERAVRGDVQDTAYALIRAVVAADGDQALGK
jgi:CubicO group peptidase (beta-lactamase class C family)